MGVYFVTQNPLDIPDTVLGQLGNRVQHALRAFTPGDQKAVKAAAETFRSNPKLDVVTAIIELEVGEALVSVLDQKGTPTRRRARLSCCRPGVGSAAYGRRSGAPGRWGLGCSGHYEHIVDRESAYEKLKEKAAQQGAPEATGGGVAGQVGQAGGKPSQTGVLIGAMVKSAAHAIGSQLGRQIIRGVLGSILGGRRR